MFAFLLVRRFLAGVLSLRYYGILGNDARHKRSIKIVSRLATTTGVEVARRYCSRFVPWSGTLGISVEMRGIEPRSVVASTGLLRAQFVKTLLFGSGACTNTYTDEPIRIKSSASPYDKGQQQWPFKTMPVPEPKACSGRQTATRA